MAGEHRRPALGVEADDLVAVGRVGAFMPGEPIGMPGAEMPEMAGFSPSMRRTSAAGTWPSTT